MSVTLLLQEYAKLKTERRLIEPYWRDAYRYTMPSRGMAFITQSNNLESNISGALNYKSKIFDSTAAQTVRLLSSDMQSGLVPSSSLWFKLAIQNQDLIDDNFKPAREWLDQASNTIFTSIHNSNFDAIAQELLIDISISGMAALFVDFINDKLHFEEWPLSQIYIKSEMIKGEIDTVYRSIQLSNSEAIKKFGFSNLPKELQQKIKGNSTKPEEYLNIIRPRIINNKISQGTLNSTMPFESIYIHLKTKSIVKTTGYNSFPVIIPRWLLIPDSDYATGPINECLPDIKTLNKTVELMLQNAEMAIAGTYIATDDGVINPNTVRIGPRRIIPVGDINSIKPLTSAGNFTISLDIINSFQAKIKSVMFSDQLQPLNNNNTMTATEVSARTALVRKILSPIYSRLQSEFLTPLLSRIFNLLYMNKKLGDAPANIANSEFFPIYQSPQARSQKLEQVDAMNIYENALLEQSKVDPGVLDNYDFDVATKTRAEIIGIPENLLRSNLQIQQIRQGRHQAQAQAQQAQIDAQTPANQRQPAQQAQQPPQAAQAELMQLLQAHAQPAQH